MTTYQVESTDWQPRLDEISRSLENTKINIEIVGMDVGNQVEAESVVLKGLVYDPKSDIVEISSLQFEHIIQSPSVIHFTEENEHIKSIEIIDSDNRRQIVTFIAPLLLTEGTN